MKKLFVVAAVALMCTPVFADTLELRVVSTGDVDAVTAAVGEEVPVMIQGRLVSADTMGLALWGANLTATGGMDLCDDTGFLVSAPVAMESFDRNLGLTNPPGPPSEITGYSGTCDGAGGLWQIGGGQNTINNSGPTVYPVGDVVEGIANGGWVDLASGSAVAIAGEVVLTLDTGFANTLDIGGGPDVYAVTAADISIVGDLTITASGCSTTAACPTADVNCDNISDGFDIAIIRRSDNWLKATGDAVEPRSDVNGDGVIDGFDIAIVRRSDCWLQ
jgi:hypothetical protein